MVETVITLVSVAFGALLTYIFQWLTESRQHKRKLRKEKVIVISHFLKEDILNGPNNGSMYAEHFDDAIYMSKIYPLFLDSYCYHPKNIREKLDEIYIQLINVELNNMPQEVTKKSIIDIADLNNQSINAGGGTGYENYITARVYIEALNVVSRPFFPSESLY